GADDGLRRHAWVAAHGVGIGGDRRGGTLGRPVSLKRTFEIGVAVGIDLKENDVVLIPQGKFRAAASTSARSQRDSRSVIAKRTVHRQFPPEVSWTVAAALF